MSHTIETSTGQAELDAEIRRFADQVNADYARLTPPGPGSLQQVRDTAEQVRERWKTGGPTMARTRDLTVPAGEGEVLVRLFEPEHDMPAGPALVYLHGGGWTLFSLETHDRLMREYAARAGIRVLGVEYSLAPEARYPRQSEEVEAVLRWLVQQGAELGIEPSSLAIGGDSAGANLALAACLRWRDQNARPALAALLLNYGAFDATAALESEGRETPAGFTLTWPEMAEFWHNYLSDPAQQHDPLACPSKAELNDLPPTFLAIAECDILLQENLEMAQALKQAGVSTRAVVYPGTTHSFLEAVSIARISEQALQESSDWLKMRLESAA